jgi:hypothetical protein
MRKSYQHLQRHSCLIAALLLTQVVPVPAQRTAAASCFASADQPGAPALLAAALDREGLYTFAGLKPVSSGFADLQVTIAPEVDRAALDSLDRLRQLARGLHCGDVVMVTQVFAATQPGPGGTQRRAAGLVLVHRGALARSIRSHAAYFDSLAITPHSEPADVIAAVEHAPRASRWRGYGYLFGYPDDAVEFFVRAGVEGDSIAQARGLSSFVVPREFRRIETVYKVPAERDGPPLLSTFVFAVPPGAPESDAERRLREDAAAIFAAHLQRRARWTDANGQLEVVALLREWLAPPP